MRAHRLLLFPLSHGPYPNRRPVMRYWIDAYNLLHALGAAPRRKGDAAAWTKARRDLMNWLAEHIRVSAADSVTAVFDAQNARSGIHRSTHRGLHVVTVGGSTADEYIEETLPTTPNRDRLTVVSNDRRVQSAARANGAKAMSSDEYIDQLLRPPAPSQSRTESASSPPTGRPRGEDTPADRERWLRAFEQS